MIQRGPRGIIMAEAQLQQTECGVTLTLRPAIVPAKAQAGVRDVLAAAILSPDDGFDGGELGVGPALPRGDPAVSESASDSPAVLSACNSRPWRNSIVARVRRL